MRDVEVHLSNMVLRVVRADRFFVNDGVLQLVENKPSSNGGPAFPDIVAIFNRDAWATVKYAPEATEVTTPDYYSHVHIANSPTSPQEAPNA